MDSVEFTGDYTNWTVNPAAGDDKPDLNRYASMQFWIDDETGDLQLSIEKPDHVARTSKKRHMNISIPKYAFSGLKKLLEGE